ncbi:hypothetical protein CALCODRAFT_437504 [Calocera cornea HHB12733]|uniref:Snurportin-1 n=1 Tax=Calocera cornea HHB12733 TaxID=1353952 RepID=A0A165EN37_9BASI|nr:hypothetical protein CALCODRAFT_437504 [Calocera cornea HHB12733]
MNHKDPHNRRASFKLPPLARAGDAQEARRLAALEQQQKRREKVITLSRASSYFATLGTLTPDSDSAPPSPSSPLKWANKLMYAEVLELGGSGPRMEVDRENGWVAVGPVPVGKRCMAVTYALENGAVVTALHSRLSGHLFLRYPSHLPPDTILDCILDTKWHETGLLHILDVMRWRSQDLSTCEAEFRFWFLQSRIAELPLIPPPSAPPFKQPYVPMPVPFYLSPLTPAVLLMNVLPPAKVGRMIPLLAPLPSPGAVLDTMPTLCASDGLLLYLKAATYQSGPTPLACWVPNQPLEGESESRLDVFERCVQIRHAQDLLTASDRLLRARAAQAGMPNGYEVTMEEG